MRDVSEAMHNAFETKCPMSESTYRTMEMKDIARILRLAVWHSHTVTVVAAVVSMLAALSLRRMPRTSARWRLSGSPEEWLPCRTTVPPKPGRRAARRRPSHLIIYITTRGDRVLASSSTTRWEKYQTIRMSIK